MASSVQARIVCAQGFPNHDQLQFQQLSLQPSCSYLVDEQYPNLLPAMLRFWQTALLQQQRVLHERPCPWQALEIQPGTPADEVAGYPEFTERMDMVWG